MVDLPGEMTFTGGLFRVGGSIPPPATSAQRNLQVGIQGGLHWFAFFSWMPGSTFAPACLQAARGKALARSHLIQ